MIPLGWVIVVAVLAVVLAVVLTLWVTFTLTRLDRLHARVDAAEAALDAQLVRRAVAVQHLADAPATQLTPAARTVYRDAAQDVVAHGTVDQPATAGRRQAVENAVGRAVTDLLALPVALDPAAEGELREASARVLIARRFYNDAVRDTRALRGRRMPRLLEFLQPAGRWVSRVEPDFFDIDDTLPPAAVRQVPDARLDGAPRLRHPEEDR